MQGAEIDVHPDTVPEGQDIEVGSSGPVFYRVDTGPWKEVPMDPGTRKGRVTAPVGARVLFFSDRQTPTGGTYVEVISAE